MMDELDPAYCHIKQKKTLKPETKKKILMEKFGCSDDLLIDTHEF